ncbi:YadA C-terminal domain-containing protein [Neisseria benedictiae]|uniref:YadA C-terminal domain-containing protein n=1 Tax=Neisseria benedictiae TaxID=2830649 RepID=UPI00261C3713|nr:YadA C-terminal domain-containing protein [Neisseria benedictiae]
MYHIKHRNFNDEKIIGTVSAFPAGNRGGGVVSSYSLAATNSDETAVVATNDGKTADAENKKLKRGLAAQAALSGLFQPYSVGKANVTAAVGGYRSQSAFAVGVGYRYNEKFATKAGFAFAPGGGAAYHAGVNFEW